MNFIPSYHFIENKMSQEFCEAVINNCYYNQNNVNLLYGKDIDLIEQYSTGDISMIPFQKMFTSLQRALRSAIKNVDGSVNKNFLSNFDKTGLSWDHPLALLPQKLNSAIATIQKILIEIQCVAQDGLAMKKKNEDIEFLKNKPLIEEDLQELADQLGAGKVNIGSTKHSSKKFSEAPMGLDLNDADEENIFAKLLYSLNVESATEKALQQIYYFTKAAQVRLLEITDQFKFGVSVHSGYIPSMTGLPNIEYWYPGDVSTPPSKLKDYSDNTHRIFDKSMTVMEMFNYFSDDIRDEAHLEEIVNQKKTGYCDCNKQGGRVDQKNWGTFKLNFKLIEVISLDWIGVSKDEDGNKSFTTNEKLISHKIWAQNTYRIWWLVNTKHFFGEERLSFSHRTKGSESYQNFSSNIYKSQPKSTVELSIGENRKAIIADIKLEFALIMSLPAGKVIDLKGMRNALSGLKDENNQWTQQDLLNLIFEKNIMIIDTEGFDGKNDGQLKPYYDIPGGLHTEITGYINTIITADRNISNLTGINEQLTGQSPNPDMLVGLQKLLINAGINSLHYAYHAIEFQYQCLFNLWGSLLQTSIEKGGKVREAIVNFIGIEDTELLDGLNETPLHNLTIKVLVVQRELERQNYLNQLQSLKEKGVISTVDEYLLSDIDNPKERFAYLAVKEKRFMKKQDQIRQENFANSQALMQKQGENFVAGKEAEGKADVNKEFAKGTVQADILRLSAQINLSKSQTDYLLKLNLQKDRGVSQKDKAISTIREKTNAKQQEAYT